MYWQLKSANDEYMKAVAKICHYEEIPRTTQWITTQELKDGNLLVRSTDLINRYWAYGYNLLTNIKDRDNQKKISIIFQFMMCLTAYECTSTTIKENSPLSQCNIFARIGSKIFKNFCICIIDQLIDLLISKVEEDKNSFIIFYDTGMFIMYKLHIDHSRGEVQMYEMRKITADFQDVFAIFMGVTMAIQPEKCEWK